MTTAVATCSLTGDPLALASALRKIEGGASQRPMNPEDQKVVNTSHLMIANPFRGGAVSGLFRTHPSTDDRVQRLQNMARNGGFYGR